MSYGQRLVEAIAARRSVVAVRDPAITKCTTKDDGALGFLLSASEDRCRERVRIHTAVAALNVRVPLLKLLQRFFERLREEIE